MSSDMFPDSLVQYLLENPMPDDNCKQCGTKIEMMAFRGSGFCSDQCKKDAGVDRPSVGTYMFVTTDEKRMIEEYRNGRP